MSLPDLVFRRWLESLADAGALVPASEVLARLGTTPDVAGEPNAITADLTAEEAGEVLGRSPSTVRSYCRDGRLPGSYRQCEREWRIPATAIETFRAEQAQPKPKAEPTKMKRRRGPVDLSAWRDEMPGTRKAS